VRTLSGAGQPVQVLLVGVDQIFTKPNLCICRRNIILDGLMAGTTSWVSASNALSECELLTLQWGSLGSADTCRASNAT